MSAPPDDNLPDVPDWTPSRMPLLWLRHHPYFWILCAIPPLLVLGAMVAGTIYQATQIETRHVRYLKALETSYKNDDLSAASRYFHKLQGDNYRRNENARFIESLLLFRAGLKKKAEDSIAMIAPDDRQGFRPAHLWRAKILAAQLGQLDTKQLQSTRHHLECALGLAESDLWVRTNLGTVCSALRDYESAAEYIGFIAPEQPSLYVMLAAIHKQLGNTDSQIAAMEKAMNHFLSELQRAPEDNQIRISLAVLQIQLDQREAATKTVTAGLKIHRNDRNLKNLYSELLISEYDELAADDKDPTRRIRILRSALEFSSDNSKAFDRLQALLSGSGEETEASRVVLADMLAKGEAVDTVHFVLGVQCINDGDLDKAEFHFRQSYQQTNLKNNSKVPVLLNNLAWLMVERKTNLPEALKLVEQAIDLLPPNDSRMPFLRETRGQAHFAVGNWQQAISDLEFALKGLPNTEVRNVHLMLFKAYSEIGLPEVAKEHKKLLDLMDE